jgi:hypothetical protein
MLGFGIELALDWSCVKSLRSFITGSMLTGRNNIYTRSRSKLNGSTSATADRGGTLPLLTFRKVRV